MEVCFIMVWVWVGGLVWVCSCIIFFVVILRIWCLFGRLLSCVIW